MNELPAKVSIIIPMYNAEEYLTSCLTSCIQQTLFDIEILCVDDGSTDATADIVRQYMKQDYRIQLISKENGGLSSARNAGLHHANGTIIMFLDSDDYLSENACERVWEEFLECEADIITFGTAIFPDIPKAIPWYYWTLTVKKARYNKFTPDVLFSNRNSKPFVWRQAFKSSFLRENKLTFDETVLFGEDVVFQMEVFPHASRFSYIPDRLYHYRHFRENSLMNSLSKAQGQKVSEHLHIAKAVAEYWDKQGWIHLYEKEFLHWLISFVSDFGKTNEVLLSEEQYKELASILKQYELFSCLRKMPFKEHKTVRDICKYGNAYD